MGHEEDILWIKLLYINYIFSKIDYAVIIFLFNLNKKKI